MSTKGDIISLDFSLSIKVYIVILTSLYDPIRTFSRTGQVDVIETVRAGEYYSLTLAAKDSGGRNSTAIMQVRLCQISYNVCIVQ